MNNFELKYSDLLSQKKYSETAQLLIKDINTYESKYKDYEQNLDEEYEALKQILEILESEDIDSQTEQDIHEALQVIIERRLSMHFVEMDKKEELKQKDFWHKALKFRFQNKKSQKEKVHDRMLNIKSIRTQREKDLVTYNKEALVDLEIEQTRSIRLQKQAEIERLETELNAKIELRDREEQEQNKFENETHLQIQILAKQIENSTDTAREDLNNRIKELEKLKENKAKNLSISLATRNSEIEELTLKLQKEDREREQKINEMIKNQENTMSEFNNLKKLSEVVENTDDFDREKEKQLMLELEKEIRLRESQKIEGLIQIDRQEIDVHLKKVQELEQLMQQTKLEIARKEQDARNLMLYKAQMLVQSKTEELEKTILVLNQEKFENQNNINKLISVEGKLNDLNQNFATLLQEKENLLSQVFALETRKNAIQQTISELNDSILNKSQEINELTKVLNFEKEDKSKIATEFQNKVNELSDLKNEFDLLKGLLAKKDIEYTDLEIAYQTESTRLKMTLDKIDVLQQDFENLNIKNGEKQELIVNLESDNSKLENKILVFSSQLLEVESEKNKILEKQSGLYSEIEKLANEIVSLQENVEKFRLYSEEKDLKINELNLKFADFANEKDSKIEELSLQFINYSEEKEQIIDQLNQKYFLFSKEKENEILDLNQKFDSYSIDQNLLIVNLIDKYNLELNIKQVTITELTEKFDKASNDFSKQIEELQNSYQLLSAEKDKEINELKIILKNLQSEISELNVSKEKSTQEYDLKICELNGLVAQLNDEFAKREADFQNKMNSLEFSNNALQNEKNELANTLEIKTKLLEVKISELTTSENLIEKLNEQILNFGRTISGYEIEFEQFKHKLTVYEQNLSTDKDQLLNTESLLKKEIDLNANNESLISNLKQEIMVLQTEVLDETRKVEQIYILLQDSDNKLQQFENEQSKDVIQVNRLKSEVEQFKHILVTKENQLSAIQTELKTKEAKIVDLNYELAQQKQLLIEMKNLIDDQEKILISYKKQQEVLKKNQVNLSDIQLLQQDYETKMANMQSEINLLKAKLSDENNVRLNLEKRLQQSLIDQKKVLAIQIKPTVVKTEQISETNTNKNQELKILPKTNRVKLIRNISRIAAMLLILLGIGVVLNFYLKNNSSKIETNPIETAKIESLPNVESPLNTQNSEQKDTPKQLVISEQTQVQNTVRDSVVNNQTNISQPINTGNTALEQISKQITDNPNDILLYMKRAAMYTVADKYESALSDYSTILQISPNDLGALVSRGYVYALMGNSRDAQNDYNKVISLDPTYVQVYINRGILFYRLENYTFAVANFDKALTLDPTNKIAAQYLTSIKSASTKK